MSERDVFLEALIKLESNCWSLVCKSYPTGGGGSDTGYEVISYHMAKPTERVEGSGDTIIMALVSAGLLLPAPATEFQLPKGWLADEFARVDADVAQWSIGIKDSFKEATGLAIPPAPAPSKGGDDE